MSLLSRFVNGSFVSSERLMHARELYVPSRPSTEPARAFAYWTERASLQSELACARELAGLPDAELQALEDEFIRCQQRPAPGWVRLANIAGLGLLGFGLLGLGAQALVEFQRAHHALESRELFPLLPKRLDATAQAELQNALEKFDREHESLRADALARAEDLIGRYGARPSAIQTSRAQSGADGEGSGLPAALESCNESS